MASISAASASVPSVESTFSGAIKKLKDIGWKYGVIPDPKKPDRIKCTLCENVVGGYKIETTYCTNYRIDYAKRQHDEAKRSEVRLDSSIEDDEVHDHSMKEPNVFGPMDNFTNVVKPEQSLERGKGKKVKLSNAIRKERMWMTKKYIARWAYESAIPFYAFEKDSFKMLLEVVGQFGPGLPPPTYELSTPLLKEEVERTKNLVKRNEKEWKAIGCSIMTDAWSDRKKKSIMNLCVNSRMGTVFYLPKNVKEQLRRMFSSTKWEECRFSGTVKGKAAFLTVLSTAFWAWVTLFLKVFTLLVKVLRMVDADWKPSMGFVYGEMIKAKEEIKTVLGDNKKAYEPILKIIEKKMKGRLDTVLHLMAYILNPFYCYKDTEIQHDPDVSDAVLAFIEIILAGDLEMQLEVTNVEMPKYKKQMDRFGTELAISACEVNNEKYDPGNATGILLS
uniref:DUF659 domain-containing protein n=1 Tax=Tanacetum cinerariifolium TaxID=118510 RepID=A0A6L2MHW0_TANCI|nr:hypothetical protein [Tanacetum cinerariifolium]